jgi:hypothetical protein
MEHSLAHSNAHIVGRGVWLVVGFEDLGRYQQREEKE